jgi:hypothetical protein
VDVCAHREVGTANASRGWETDIGPVALAVGFIKLQLHGAVIRIGFANPEGTVRVKVLRGDPSSARSQGLLQAALIDAVVFCVRPLLRVQLALYKQDIRSAPFPADEPELLIAGPDPDHLLFIGDVAVAGYGVVEYGMTVVFRTARLISKERGRGCWWATIGAPDLTVAQVARMPGLDAAKVDVAIIMLGIPDVLLGTSSTKWATNLIQLIDRIHEQSAADCRIVLAGIAPMGDFRPMPPWVRKILMLQIHRLNGITLATATHRPNTSFAPFPDWQLGKMSVEQLFSWRQLHEMWARVLASATMWRVAFVGTSSPRSWYPLFWVVGTAS